MVARLLFSPLFLGFVFFVVIPAMGQPLPSGDRSPSETVSVSPSQDDAGLNDVQFVGARHGWAVGDEGVIWRTEDGGTTWTRQPVPVTCTLWDVCFLTDRVGWVVGEGTTPVVRTRYGVLLSTVDGGETWTVHKRLFPPLRSVTFFGPDEGVMVGDSSSEFPTGLLFTEDGGETWTAMPGPYRLGWNDGAFLTPRVGVVVGEGSLTASVGGGRLLPHTEPTGQLRGYRDVHLPSEGMGWMVGDGGTIRRTLDRGASWQSPPQAFPVEIGEFCDFRAVAAIESNVWVVGSPGSVVFHSPDGGRSWRSHRTGQTAPLSAIHFRDASHGWAVGELGVILRTDDGGTTWTTVRGANRHLAALSVIRRPSDLDAALLASQGGDLGYRCGVLLPIRHDIEPDGHRETDPNPMLREATRRAGGATTITEWAWPIALPELEKSEQRLLAEWNELSDDRLADLLIGKLVAGLRTWRPTVVILPPATADDAATDLVRRALLRAIDAAGDPTAYPTHLRFGDLKPHRVGRIYSRLSVGERGLPQITLDEYLPRLNGSVRERAVTAWETLDGAAAPKAPVIAYRPEPLPGSEETAPPVASGDFFAGVSIRPDSEARRRLGTYDETDADRRADSLMRRKHFRNLFRRALADDRQSAGIIAHLRQLTEGLDPDTAARELAAIAEGYRSAGRMTLAEEVWIELIEQHPNHPAAVDAMRRLFWRFASTEVTWHRSAEIGGTAIRSHLNTPGSWNGNALIGRVSRAYHQSSVSPFQRSEEFDLGPDPASVLTRTEAIEIDNGSRDRDQRTESIRQREEAAIRLAGFLRKVAPHVYAQPEVQFPLAALMRRRGHHGIADELHNRYRLAAKGDPWREVVEGETWLTLPQHTSPRPIFASLRTPVRPRLDGVFSDDCWRDAGEILLTGMPSRDGSPEKPVRVQIRHDNRFLYFSISVPRVPDAEIPKVLHAGRTHDADLTGHDRVRIGFDLDRDYRTHFEIEIDERGHVREKCAGDASWNPKLFVAVEGVPTHWRAEVAIPLTELTPVPPMRGEVWGLGIDRIAPAEGMQSWTVNPTRNSTPKRFGLLKFR